MNSENLRSKVIQKKNIFTHKNHTLVKVLKEKNKKMLSICK